MIIKESDYVMRHLGGDLFDLKLRIVKKKKDGTFVDDEEIVYGCSLFSALRRIVSNRVKLKNREGAIDIKKYRNDLISEMKFLHDIFDK